MPITGAKDIVNTNVFIPRYNFTTVTNNTETIKKEIYVSRPTFKAGKINVIGQVSIKFSQNMLVDDDLDFSQVFELFIQSQMTGKRE